MKKNVVLFLIMAILGTNAQELLERMVEEKKCQKLCKMDLDYQCNQCNTRMPIRFGKRSREIEVKVLTYPNRLTGDDYLIQVLLGKIFLSKSDMVRHHLKN